MKDRHLSSKVHSRDSQCGRARRDQAHRLCAFVGLAAVCVCLCGCPNSNIMENPNIDRSFGNRVLVGEVVDEGHAKWDNLDKDVKLHVRSNLTLTLSANQIRSAKEGTRCLMGPWPQKEGAKINAKIVSKPIKDANNITTHDLAAEVDSGYAALWGWRPYIRLQRISAAAEGTQIIGVVVSATDEKIEERVYILDEASRVIVRDQKGAEVARFSSNQRYMTFITDKDGNTTTDGRQYEYGDNDPLVKHVIERLK